jgi:hypothetical protein
MHPSDPNDPSILNMAGVKALADLTILNESDLPTLENIVEVTLNR